MAEVHRFLGELIMVCKALGGAVLESDDGGDRWIDIRRGKLWGQIRSRYSFRGDEPVWEITIGMGITTKLTEYVPREG